MTKKEALIRWAQLRPRQNPLPSMNPIPNKTSGSRYGCCGIRIDGTPEFIDAVLSNLKDLIDGENGRTRLELARREVADVEVAGKRKSFTNRERQAEVCYIRLHERGPEAQMVNAFIDAFAEATS